jgi:hypothetical protein
MYAWLMSCSQRSYFEPSGSSRIFLAKILCATSATNDIVRSRLPGIAYIPLILIVHPIPIQQLKINPLPNESTNCTLPIAFIPGPNAAVMPLSLCFPSSRDFPDPLSGHPSDMLALPTLAGRSMAGEPSDGARRSKVREGRSCTRCPRGWWGRATLGMEKLPRSRGRWEKRSRLRRKIGEAGRR